MEPIELLLEANPKTWSGANKLLGAMKAASGMLEQEIDESNVQADRDAKQRQLKALGERMAALSGRPGLGEVFGPAWEQCALERLMDVNVRRERELAADLEDDTWDIAAWCDGAFEAGLIEPMERSTAPRRHWTLTRKGHESIAATYAAR